jgi:dienelactone hydrolase
MASQQRSIKLNTAFKSSFISLLLIAVSATTTLANAVTLTDLSGGQTGRIEFKSITSPNRWEYARLNLQNTKQATIFADLLMPKNMGANKVPAVVLSHGSGGVESNMQDVWVKELNAAGYAVFIPDSYKPRGVSETNSNQEAVPYPAHVADTLNALMMLATHPQIDKSKIYNMGFSRGGSTVFDTAWPMWQRPVNTGEVKFAGHIAWYPGNCNLRYRTDDVEQATAPIFVLLADKEFEEAQDVSVCRRWYDELAAKGNKITYKEYKGARHGFDGLNFTYRVNPRTSSGRKCDMEIYMTTAQGSGVGKNGFDFKLKKEIKSFQDFNDSAKACLENGTVPGSRGGGNAKEVQAESVKDVLAFLQSLK